MQSKQTPSQTIGPFFHFGLLTRPDWNCLTDDQTQGQPITLKGKVVDGEGSPLIDAMLEIWQADANGIYDHPADPNRAQIDPHFRGFGRADTVQEGHFSFQTIKPGRITYDSTRQQAPHINLRVFARGMLVHACTRLYFSDEVQANAEDPVLSLVEPERRPTLIARREDTAGLVSYCFNVVLQGAHETVFFDL